MAYTIGTGERNAAANSHSQRIYDAAVMEIRSGAPPGPDAAASGTLLASISLPADAHAAAAAGSAAKQGTWSDTSADAGGTAGHFRIRQSGDANGADAASNRAEGTVTATGGGGDLELDNPVLAAGQAVEITTFPVSVPAS